MVRILQPEERREAVNRMHELSNQDILLCLQCGKCTAGCPFSDEMDLAPHQVVRMAQLGLIDELKASEAIWYCATCFTCVSRCPVAIDIAAVAEVIRLYLQMDDEARFDPESIPKSLTENAPQQALVSLYRKFGN